VAPPEMVEESNGKPHGDEAELCLAALGNRTGVLNLFSRRVYQIYSVCGYFRAEITAGKSQRLKEITTVVDKSKHEF
jgi:hypothetical protein